MAYLWGQMAPGTSERGLFLVRKGVTSRKQVLQVLSVAAGFRYSFSVG